MARPTKLKLEAKGCEFPEVPTSNIINDIGIASSPSNSNSPCLKEIQENYWKICIDDKMSKVIMDQSIMMDDLKAIRTLVSEKRESILKSEEGSSDFEIDEDLLNEDVVPIESLRWDEYADTWDKFVNKDNSSIETRIHLDVDVFTDVLSSSDKILIYNWDNLKKFLIGVDSKFYESVLFFNRKLFCIWKNSVNSLSSYTEAIRSSTLSDNETIYSYIDDILTALYHTFTTNFIQLLDTCTTSVMLKSLAVTFVYGVAFNILYKFPDFCSSGKLCDLHTAIFNKLKKMQSMKTQYIVTLNSRVGVTSIKKLLVQNANPTMKKLSFWGKFKLPTKTSIVTYFVTSAISVGVTLILVRKNRESNFLFWFAWKSIGKSKGWK